MTPVDFQHLKDVFVITVNKQDAVQDASSDGGAEGKTEGGSDEE